MGDRERRPLLDLEIKNSFFLFKEDKNNNLVIIFYEILVFLLLCFRFCSNLLVINSIADILLVTI